MEIITCHKGADFDALASVVAGAMVYPDAVPVLPKSVNPNVKAFLSIHKDLFEAFSIGAIDLDKVNRLIVVDTDRWGRLDRLAPLKDHPGLEVILWDHHFGGDIEPNWKCQEKVGATTTLMLREIKKNGIELSPILATLLLAGIYEDTGSLSFPSTTPEDAHAAGYLLENGADLRILSTFLRPAYGEKQKKILFHMLHGAERKKIKGYKIGCSAVEMEKHVGNLSVVVQMYREILNVDAAFGIFLQKNKDSCTVIARSGLGDLDVGAIMKRMGGGGHPGAGSVRLKSVKPEAVEKWIFELLSGNRRTSATVSDLMSHPVHSVTSDTPMKDLAATLRKKSCTGVPVIDDGTLAGVISRRDFIKVKKNRMTSPVKAYMSRKNITVAPDKSPMEAARIMVKHDIGRLPVADNGVIIGIISRSDCMTYFYDLLPE